MVRPLTPNDLWVPLIDPQQTSDRREVRVNFVSARYFETVGMRMTRGRPLNEAMDMERSKRRS